MCQLLRAASRSACLVFASLAFPAFSATLVGHTPGDFSAGQTGAANYSVPIVVAPGAGGLQPSLGLSYSSGRGDGLAGYGWNITGFSVITRCAQNLAQDSAVRGIRADTQDRFCLDGQRLRLTSGAYGGNNSQYRTELESFVRVTAWTSGGSGSLPSSGPQWFQVETRDGLTFEYGESADSRIEFEGTSIARVWALSKVSDRFGNYALYEYAQDTANGSYRPDRVRYSGHGAAAPTHSVEFEYEPRPTAEYVGGYLAGSLSRQTYRLTHVRTLFGGSTVRDYQLTYTPDGVDLPYRSRLESIEECAGADCYPATTLDWQSGTEGWNGLVATAVAPGQFQFAHAVDVNGDGRQDLVFPRGAAGSEEWGIITGAANGFSGLTDTNRIAVNFDQTHSIDYNSDGLRDLIYPDGNWKVLRSTGSSFAAPVSMNAPTDEYSAAVTTFGDFNGDGREDLLWATSASLMLRLNTGGNFESTARTAFTQSGQTHGALALRTMNTINSGHNRVADFDGDGRADLLILTTRTTDYTCDDEPGCIDPPPTSEDFWVVLYSDGVTFTRKVTIGSATEIFDPKFADMNGDGLTDLLYRKGSSIKLRLSTGSGFDFEVGTQSSTGFADALLVDWDSDGMTDLLAPPASSGNWQVLRSRGNDLEARRDTGTPATGSANEPRVLDIDGDGLSDIAVAYNSKWQYLDHKGVFPDLLQTVTDGFGNQFTPTFKPLTDSAVYTKGTAAAAFPEIKVQPPQYVVSSYASNDGIGGTFTVTYDYVGARFHAQGRGFLGFSEIKSVDSRTGISTTNGFFQAHPYTGLLKTSVARRSTGAILSDVTQTTDQKVYGTGTATRAFPFIKSRVEESYELGNQATPFRTVTTNFTYDLNGNPLEVQTTASGASGAYASTTTTDFDNDLTGWCLGLPNLIQVSNDSPNATPQTRTRSAINNMVDCNVQEETIESDVTIAYAYDTFGNQDQITVTGAGEPQRITRINYGSAGIYPETITNAEGHVTRQTWDLELGVPKTIRDPNLNTTTRTYDSFGRLKTETRADGTKTQITLASCPTGCGVPNGRYKLTTELKNASGLTGGKTITIHDSYGREVRREQVMPGGAISYVRTNYDSRGNVDQVSSPSASTTPADWTDYTYDELSRVMEIDSPIDEINASGRKTTFDYAGLVTTQYDALNRPSERETDALGQVIKMVDAPGGVTRYEYDGFGNLTKVTDPALNVTTATYDVRGFKLKTVDPDAGTWIYTYTPFGELASQKDAKGQIVTFDYDRIGRVTRRHDPGTASTAYTVFTYDTAPGAGVGFIDSVTAPDGYVQMNYYDAVSRPTEVITTQNNETYVVSATYDSYSRVDTVEYPESVGNQPPVANAGPDQSIGQTGTVVTLNGSGSADPDASPQALSYAWSKVSGPTATISNASSAVASFTPGSTGTYVFRLTVNDGADTGSDDVQITVGSSVPAAPASITVPSGVNATGSYTVSWDSVSGATRYEFFEATVNTFAGQTAVTLATATSLSEDVTGKGNGDYFYRVRACNAAGCSSYRAGTNQAAVLRTPTSISSSENPSVDGSYTVSWGATGNVTHQLYEATASSFAGQTLVAGVTGPSMAISGKGNGTWFYRARVCSKTSPSLCGGYKAMTSGVAVTLPPPVPTALYVPASDFDGSISLSWTGANGAADFYQVQRATVSSYSGAVYLSPHPGQVTSTTAPGLVSGTHYFRVRACHPANTSACSGFRNGNRAVVVVRTPSIARNKSWAVEPASFIISWSVAGTVDKYELYQSTDANPSSWTLVYSGTGLSKSFSNMAGPRTYNYRVRACIGTLCGNYSGTTWVEVLDATTPQSVTDPTGAEPLAMKPGWPEEVSDPPADAQPTDAVPVGRASARQASSEAVPAGRASARHPATAAVPSRPAAAPLRIAQTSPHASANRPRIQAGSGGGGAGSGFRFKVRYRYDAEGYLEQVENAADPAEVYWQAIETDAWGHVQKESLGNGLTTSRDFDQAAGFLNSIKTGVGTGTTVQNLAYEWDLHGNLSRREDNNQGTLNETFSYDSLNRLDTVSRNGTQTLNVNYDGIGNITSKSDVAGSYGYGAGTAGPHAVTAIGTKTYGYDLNGNMTNRAGTTLSWTSFNAPQRITVSGGNYSEFSYDPFRARTKQVLVKNNALSRTTVYVGGLFERNTEAGITEYRHRIFADGREVATYVRRSNAIHETQYVHQDHLGSVDVITDQNRTEIATLSFDAFGKRRAANWTPTPPPAPTDISTRGFTEHEHLDQAGLIHMNGRVYDPVIGRFLSADPFVQAPLFSQSYNRYSYVFNNPLSFVDPSGFTGLSLGLMSMMLNGGTVPLPPITVRGRRSSVGQAGGLMGGGHLFGGGRGAVNREPGNGGFRLRPDRGNPGDVDILTENGEDTEVNTTEACAADADCLAYAVQQGFEHLESLNNAETLQQQTTSQILASLGRGNTRSGPITFLLGAGGSIVLFKGIEGSISGFVTVGEGLSDFDVGLAFAHGAGEGINISADLFAGANAGTVFELVGQTNNVNVVLGALSLTTFNSIDGSSNFNFFHASTYHPTGGTIGFGPAFPGFGVSVSRSTTRAISYRTVVRSTADFLCSASGAC